VAGRCAESVLAQFSGSKPGATPDFAEIEAERPELKEPPQYAVVLHNDDYTTMEFVVEVLQKYFRRTHEEATEITLRVHHEGRGVAGIYGFEIAETKVAQVMEYAKAHEYPLKASCEPA